MIKVNLNKQLDAFFKPKSIAVIGASRQSSTPGRVILENLVYGNYKGKVFAVNPKADFLLGKKVYSSISKIKEKIDLAVIAVPAKFVPQIVNECGNKKIPAVLIVSAGFNEIGNNKLTNELKKEIKKFPKMKIIGPNCIGILNTENDVDTIFNPDYKMGRPKSGDVAFISQSGALGVAVLDWASMQNYGISKFVSYGNAFDVDETDLLEYFINDKKTKVIVMYIEGLKNGRKFFELAKKLGHKKPIIILKGGQSSAGVKAVSSHTGSLAGSSKIFNTLFKQTALIKAENLLELFDFARVFSKMPKPKGKKIQIITDGGGYGVLTVDLIEKYGLELAELNKKSKKELRKIVPPYVVLKNPIDLTGNANPEMYYESINTAMKDKKINQIIAIILYQLPEINPTIIEKIIELNKRKTKPFIVISVGGHFTEIYTKALEKEGVVNFSYPFSAVKALKALNEFYSFKK